MTANHARAGPVLPRTVWALGLVSLFMDVSSEMVHALLPLFLTGTLGASVLVVGAIEGIGEAAASIVKVFSGYVSDRIGRRKPLILLGYALGALSKPLFAIAGAPGMVLAARFTDRIGKGIRGAPRDALIADVTPAILRGRAFGLRQSLDTAGAFIGPLCAIGLMALLANNMRVIFWLALIPGLIAVLLVVFRVDDLDANDVEAAPPPIRLQDLKSLRTPFWQIVALGVVFMLARFSEAFLILRAHQLGLPLYLAPLVLVAMNLVYSAGAYPAGMLSDRVSSSRLLTFSLLALIAADLCLALFDSVIGVFSGITLWGSHMALSQGLLSKLVADRAPPHLRASAFGLFNLCSGLSLLGASLLAGLLWTTFGATTTFLAGAGIAAFVVLMIPHCLKSPKPLD
ncbi:MAG: MFS transporter [Hyphomonas sp.]|uniref:MFS transporter n=1 Tax=Hyphomonas sp. TaxID=87 RepID=UPI0005F238EE|nr:MFS transporter [Hyphomonas sp.]KJS28057.1 MAG: MFS transporter [Hyphomonadaceae bacterium BRH_c29]MBU3920749.1 MFS transporter [Alphaproteobacteria bacterium]MBA3070194.1 MFS transporter [Hyphomonas sp.]MBU4060230.1 MFS transporter [Alphaproteobacteria bacterium]MBU4162898.1 MFS transporter [Alphaproteobacteria bacterium]